LAVAERLGAGDATADKAEIFGVPTEVLAFDLGVVDGNVFALPERIFGVENSVVNLDVAGVLEDVFADEVQIPKSQIAGMHKGVRSLLDMEVGYLAGTAVPESFRAIGHLDSLQSQAVYLAEDFWCIDEAVEEPQIAAVPHRRAIRRREIAVAAGDVLTLPDDVHALETAVESFNMARLFESRLAFADGDAGELEVAALI